MPFNDTRVVRGGPSIPSFKLERMIAEGKLERLSDGQVQKTRYRTSEFRGFPNFFDEEGARFD